MANIVVCPKCNKNLIQEESSIHRCSCQIIDVNYKWWINSDITGIGEVIILEDEFGALYRMKPYQPTGNMDNTTDKEPVPDTRFCYLISCFC